MENITHSEAAADQLACPEDDSRSPEYDNLIARRQRRAHFIKERSTFAPLVEKLVKANCRGDRHERDAEDAAQSAVLGLYRAQRNGSENARRLAEGPANELGAYLWRASANEMNSIYRGRSRRPTVSIDALQQSSDEQGGVFDGWEPTTNTFEEHLVEALDVRRTMASVLAELPERQRAAVRLKVGGHDYREIAEELGTSLSAANSLQNHGMKVVWKSIDSGSGAST